MHLFVIASVMLVRLLQAPPVASASVSPQAYLTLVLPAILAFLGTTFAGWIRQDGFNVWFNRALAALAILIAAVLSVYVNGQLTGNFSLDYASIQAAIALLMGGILAPLGKEFQSNWFAFLPAKQLPVPVSHPAQLRAVTAPPAQNTSVNPSRTSNAAGWQPTAQSWNGPQQQSSTDQSG